MRLRHFARRALMMLGLTCAACSGPSQPNHSDPMHAIAIAYIKRPLAGGFSVAGTFVLPRVAQNRGWYAQWITYAGKLSQMLPNSPYVQAGLIRSPGGRSELEAFVAERPHGGTVALRTLGAFGDGPHHLAFALRDGTIVYAVDGRVLFRQANADFFAADATDTYLQIGHELSQARDRARGSISNVVFSVAGTAPERPFSAGPGCYFYSNGVTLAGARDRMVAQGSFDPDVVDTAECDR